MQKIVIIPTEKTGEDDFEILNQVIQSLNHQTLKPDLIIIVKNHKEGIQFNINDKIESKIQIIELEKSKDKKYEAASVRNKALEYISSNIDEEKLCLYFLDDDCIVGKNYTKNLFPKRENEIRTVSPLVRVNYLKEKDKAKLVQRYEKTIRERATQTIKYYAKLILQSITKKELFISQIHFIEQSLKRGRRALGIISVILDMELIRILRYDENYDGNWGLEDSDFVMQIMEKGYYLTILHYLRVFHVHTEWKDKSRIISKDGYSQKNFEERVTKNPNEKYYYEKWKAKL